MKLSKTLLSAMLIGIVSQTAVSCSKSKAAPTSKQESKKKTNQPTVPQYCPACGLG